MCARPPRHRSTLADVEEDTYDFTMRSATVSVFSISDSHRTREKAEGVSITRLRLACTGHVQQRSNCVESPVFSKLHRRMPSVRACVPSGR